MFYYLLLKYDTRDPAKLKIRLREHARYSLSVGPVVAVALSNELLLLFSGPCCCCCSVGRVVAVAQ